MENLKFPKFQSIAYHKTTSDKIKVSLFGFEAKPKV